MPINNSSLIPETVNPQQVPLTINLTLPANLPPTPSQSAPVFRQLIGNLEILRRIATHSYSLFCSNLGIEVKGAPWVRELPKGHRPPRTMADPQLLETVESIRIKSEQLIREGYRVGHELRIDFAHLRVDLEACRAFLLSAVVSAQQPLSMGLSLNNWAELRDTLEGYAAISDPKEAVSNFPSVTNSNQRQSEIQEPEAATPKEADSNQQKKLPDSSEFPPKIEEALRQKFSAIDRSQKSDEMLDPNSSDSEVYDWLKEDGELHLPKKETWLKYQQRARKILGQPKSTPKGGRPKGINIVNKEDIE